MIGIDIIDLQDPLLKSRDLSGRFIHHPNDNPHLHFWLHWTAKEAIFKCKRKPGPFKPKDIPINFISDTKFHSAGWKGTVVSTDNYCLSLAGSFADHYIFSKETSDPTREIRMKIARWFWEEHHIETSVITDSAGLPIMSHDHSPISISHHGRFMAFNTLAN